MPDPILNWLQQKTPDKDTHAGPDLSKHPNPDPKQQENNKVKYGIDISIFIILSSYLGYKCKKCSDQSKYTSFIFLRFQEKRQ